jgi:hypothetical protein
MVKNLLALAVVVLAGLSGCRLIGIQTVTYQVRREVDPSSATPVAPVA